MPARSSAGSQAPLLRYGLPTTRAGRWKWWRSPSGGHPKDRAQARRTSGERGERVRASRGVGGPSGSENRAFRHRPRLMPTTALELTRCLRTRRSRRQRPSRQGHMPDMVLIQDRPAEVTDRAGSLGRATAPLTAHNKPLGLPVVPAHHATVVRTRNTFAWFCRVSTCASSGSQMC